MTRRHIGLLLAVACLLFVGCGGSTLGAAATATSTRTPLPTATTLPSPTASPTRPPDLTCTDSLRNSGSNAVQSGDLLILFAFGLSYPSHQLPDGLPLAPYQLGTLPPDAPAVNPAIADPVSGFNVILCNTGTASHTLGALGVSIQSFTAYSGALNAWNPCDTTYSRQTGPAGGGCGGGVGDPNCLLASFPSGASTGATATVASTGCTQQMPPATIKPNDAFYGNLGVVMPTAAGTYGIALTYTLDGGSTVSVPFAQHLLLAPIAHQWDGKACTSSAMQAQIPSANPGATYVCPKS